MKDFFKLMAYIGLFTVAAILAIFFAFWIAIAAGAFIGIALAAWSVGIPFTVTENGVKTGYVRWFTFYPRKV